MELLDLTAEIIKAHGQNFARFAYSEAAAKRVCWAEKVCYAEVLRSGTLRGKRVCCVEVLHSGTMYLSWPHYMTTISRPQFSS